MEIDKLLKQVIIKDSPVQRTICNTQIIPKTVVCICKIPTTPGTIHRIIHSSSNGERVVINEDIFASCKHETLDTAKLYLELLDMLDSNVCYLNVNINESSTILIDIYNDLKCISLEYTAKYTVSQLTDEFEYVSGEITATDETLLQFAKLMQTT